MQTRTDEQLMLDYQNGEVQAMDEFLRRYKNPVYHFALRLSRNAVRRIIAQSGQMPPSLRSRSSLMARLIEVSMPTIPLVWSMGNFGIWILV